MIQTAIQLKAKIRNISGGNSTKAQMLIRNYMMERFLERCAVSEYRNHFILKGGMLIASCVGLDARATMDIDTTVRALPLTPDSLTRVIQEVINIPLEDGVAFQVVSAREIMEEHEYPGLRFMLEGALGQMKQPIKIDISTNDVITPSAVEYSYPLMFEDRSISVLSYNLETVLSEKMETILSRAEANTRMRDFYDIYILLTEKYDEISETVLQAAFPATCRKRNTDNTVSEAGEILAAVRNSEVLRKQWNNYRSGSCYVGALEWQEVIEKTVELAKMLRIV